MPLISNIHRQRMTVNRKFKIFFLGCLIIGIFLILHSILAIRILASNYGKELFAFSFLVWSVYIMFSIMICIARKSFIKSIAISIFIYIILMAINFTAMKFSFPDTIDQQFILVVFMYHSFGGPLWLLFSSLLSGFLIEIKKNRDNLDFKPIEQKYNSKEDLDT